MRILQYAPQHGHECCASLLYRSHHHRALNASSNSWPRFGFCCPDAFVVRQLPWNDVRLERDKLWLKKNCLAILAGDGTEWVVGTWPGSMFSLYAEESVRFITDRASVPQRKLVPADSLAARDFYFDVCIQAWQARRGHDMPLFVNTCAQKPDIIFDLKLLKEFVTWATTKTRKHGGLLSQASGNPPGCPPSSPSAPPPPPGMTGNRVSLHCSVPLCKEEQSRHAECSNGGRLKNPGKCRCTQEAPAEGHKALHRLTLEVPKFPYPAVKEPVACTSAVQVRKPCFLRQTDGRVGVETLWLFPFTTPTLPVDFHSCA